MARTAIVAAGGTGGHMFPAQALAETLAARGWKVVLATDSRGAAYAEHFPAEERIALSASTFRAGDPIGMVRAGVAIAQGVSQAKTAFKRLDPAVVVGFGGYPSLPTLLAARGRIPTVIHEQNSVLGRTNRFLAPKVDQVACAFPTLERAEPAVKARAVVVGNPVRPDIQAIYDQAYPTPSADGRLTLLIVGGSQGARLLSERVPEAVGELPQALRMRLIVQQQTRPESINIARRFYRDGMVEAEIAPFFRDMASRLAAAHLVVGRAGASTCCELAVAGRPSILAPLKIATDDHQRLNAKLLNDAGAAEVIAEDDLTVERLRLTLERLLEDPQRLTTMAGAARAVAQPDAAARLADLVENTAR